jgi:diacylglycerol kinase family enzyme
VPLGILPLGTGNGLARGLKIPLDLDGALNLLTGEHSIMPVDALKVDRTYYVLNVSAGISPRMMQETKTELKKRFGRLAYLWTALRRIDLFRVRRYRLTVDGQSHWVLGTEVLIANGTVLEDPTSTFGPPEAFNDQQLEVYVLTARNLFDYAQLVWAILRHAPREAPVVSHFPARRSVSLKVRRRSQLVQADGEVIGHTPVTIELVPAAVQVIVPPTAVAVPPTAVAVPSTAATAAPNGETSAIAAPS